MLELSEFQVACPYCGETIAVQADGSAVLQEETAAEQHYYEDCQVCCRPILFSIQTDLEGQVTQLSVRREDD